MRALVGLLVVSSVIVAGCGGDKSGSSGPQYSCDKVQPSGFPIAAEGVEEGNTAPDLSFTTTVGDVSCTRDFTGKVVLINIAAGWCPPCQTETPGFVDVYEEFKNDGFVILQAMFEDYDGGNPDPAFMEEWKEEFDIPFTLIPDPSNDFWDEYVPPSNTGYIPHNLILDRDGVISFTDYGGVSESFVRARVRSLVEAEPTLDYGE